MLGTNNVRRVAVILGAAGLVTCTALIVMRERGHRRSVADTVPSSGTLATGLLPTFGRPEEAARYFAAMIEGDTRAIQALDRALAQVRVQKGPNAPTITDLEQQRAARVARLEAHKSARDRSAR